MPKTISDKTEPSDYAEIRFKTKEDIAPQGEFKRPGNVKLQFDETKEKIQISWDAVENVSYYDIKLEYQNRGSNSFPITYTVSADKTSFIAENLKYGETVTCCIAARNENFTDSCRWTKLVSLKLK